MAENMNQDNVARRLENIDGEEDLKPRPGHVNINPPPPDEKCMCCGRHMSELKPFGKAGDPLVGDFDGALLVRKFRTFLPPPDIRLEKTFQWMLLNCQPKDENESEIDILAREYEEEDAKAIWFMINEYCQVGKSWECRDCAVLDTYEYFEKLGYDLDEYYAWKPRQKNEAKPKDVQKSAA